ncbi:Formin-like protein 1 [Zootermopsis nevadensis]|uniref:Formin-like protein 1 n=1 Tax=Zootermopsis nevadensis TaxID=136037 RepID=A0A067RC24_ZOONE|nr:Formin-like protein 1 [Zootermopsis nevadensis]
MSLRKWGRRSGSSAQLYGLGSAVQAESADATLKSAHNLQQPVPGQSSKDYRNPILTPTTPHGEEMSLRQFSTVTELLGKLKADLRLAFPSFVQEFIGDPLDGVTLLLELLRAVQLSQASQQTRCPPPVLRRALLDEHSCLQCIRSCLRCPDAARRLAASPAGLFTLAVCIMSNVSKSRVIALELLTKACEPPGCGHGPVSEALSTLRLRFGEPVRFRFLVGMLSSAGGCPELQAAGVRFLNTLIETAPNPQSRLYLQAELEQAGFYVSNIKKVS